MTISKNMKAVGAFTFMVTALSAFGVSAATTAEIRDLLDAGEYAEAARLAEESVRLAEPKDQPIFYQLLGEARYYQPGHRKESYLAFEEAADKGVPEASLYLGRLAMLDYDFPKAQQMFGRYKAGMQKAKRQLDPDFDYDQQDLREGLLQFDRMQDIVVIDAVKVPLKEFAKHLRLPLSAGRVIPAGEMPIDSDGVEMGPTGFITESGDLMMWSEVNDSTGMYQLAEAARLTDGSYTDTEYLPEFLYRGGDAISPFLSADGTTLYFASNGDGSMGGYDIFLASRDPLTGEYLQPVNAGIPFNSSADEYVLAVDEENGVGWWASDRQLLPDGMITLYVYVLPETRVNLEADPEEKRLRARLDDIRLTWSAPVVEDDGVGQDEDDGSEEDEESEGAGSRKPAAWYRDLAAEIRKIEPGMKPRRDDCEIPLGKGKFIRSVDDVSTAAQKKMVEEYMVAKKKYDTDAERLAEMRRDYSRQSSRAVGMEIDELEGSVANQKKLLTALLSGLYKSLGRK